MRCKLSRYYGAIKPNDVVKYLVLLRFEENTTRCTTTKQQQRGR